MTGWDGRVDWHDHHGGAELLGVSWCPVEDSRASRRMGLRSGVGQRVEGHASPLESLSHQHTASAPHTAQSQGTSGPAMVMPSPVLGSLRNRGCVLRMKEEVQPFSPPCSVEVAVS